jgi:hypothetical protein
LGWGCFQFSWACCWAMPADSTVHTKPCISLPLSFFKGDPISLDCGEIHQSGAMVITHHSHRDCIWSGCGIVLGFIFSWPCCPSAELSFICSVPDL